MKIKSILQVFVLSFGFAVAARADLVGLWTFDRENPFEAVVGSPAREGTAPSNNKPVVLSDSMSALFPVNDSEVLGERTGVVAVPSLSTLAIPNPGLQKDWTIQFWFYAPASANWRCFFQFNPGNGSDGSLFIKNNTGIGAGSYDTVPNVVGAWHQLVVSSAANKQTIWFDRQKMANTREWDIAGQSILQFSLDNDGEDATMYFDEIRLYDETAPAELFPDGLDDGPVLLDRYAEPEAYSDKWGSFSRAPDSVIDQDPYRVYVFSRHGSFLFTPNKASKDAELLVVGGGGAGGMLRGGGGGAGGVVHVESIDLAAQTYTATVGAGGVPDIHPYWYSNGSNVGLLHPGVSSDATCGGASTVATASGTIVATAAGGGGGGNFNYTNGNLPAEGYGLDGASGGGAAGKSTAPGAGIDGQGNAGGEASTDGDSSGGGGGGAGAAGAKGTNAVAGTGGDGVACSITGEEVYYGGGGGASSYNLSGGAGGAGGGGAGVASTAVKLRSTAVNGADGLGGGGGGGSGQNNNPYNSTGGRGGDGAVILRVLAVDSDAEEPTLSVVANPVGYTDATITVKLVSFGSGASSATVSLVVSPREDLSNPVFSGVLATDADSLASFVQTIDELDDSKVYYARATAVNDLGVAGESALVTFSTLVPGAPSVGATPTGTGFCRISATGAISSFGAGSDWADLYLDCSLSGDFTDAVSSASARASEVPFSAALTTAGLAPGATYFYRVRAVNEWGIESVSDVYQATTDSAPVRLSPISAAAESGGETLSVSALSLEPGAIYSLTLSVDGVIKETWTAQGSLGTFSVHYSGASGSSHSVVVNVSATLDGETYADTRTLTFTIGGNVVVVSAWSDHVSAADAIRVHPGDAIILPQLAYGWSYKVLNSRSLSLDGTKLTALQIAVAGVEVYNGSTFMGTVAVLVLPEAIEGGDVYIYNEKTSGQIWNNAEAWEKVGSNTNDFWPANPNDIAVLPFYDATGTFYLQHMTDFSLGGVLFGSFVDASLTCILQRHDSVGTKTVSFERTDGEPAFVKVTPNTTSERSNTLRFGGHEIVVDCVSSVETDAGSDPSDTSLNRGFITYNSCTVNIPAGSYWAVDGLPGYGLNMGGTIGAPTLTGEGTFWKRGMGGITMGNQRDFYGTVLDSSHGQKGGFNRAGPIFWHGGGGTNISATIAGCVYPQVGNPSVSANGYGWFKTGWDPGYGHDSPSAHYITDADGNIASDENGPIIVPWNPRKTMTMHGGCYDASTTEGSEWGVGARNPRIYEGLDIETGFSYISVGDGRSNNSGHPINYVEYGALSHADKGTLCLFDGSRRSVAATASGTNDMVVIRNVPASELVGAEGDCRESDVYPIVPWAVSPTTTDDGSWRNTMFLSFEPDGRLTRPVWSNTALDAAASPCSNAYLWDKTIEIGADVTLNSLFMNNSGKNKWLGEGRTLTLTSGGLVLCGNNTAIGEPGRGDNGSLVLGDADHPGYVFAKATSESGPNQIWADVTAPGGFVSSYPGRLVLGGDQTKIANELVVNAGILTLGTAELECSLAKELNIRVCAGAQLAIPRADTLKGLYLRLDGAAGQLGTIRLDADTSVKKCYVRDWPAAAEWTTLPRGTYGSSDSAADNIRDDLFSGTGVLYVRSDDRRNPLVITIR